MRTFSIVYFAVPAAHRGKINESKKRYIFIPARTYIQQLSEDMGCSPGDLPEAMNDGEVWRERVRDIRADGATR